MRKKCSLRKQPKSSDSGLSYCAHFRLTTLQSEKRNCRGPWSEAELCLSDGQKAHLVGKGGEYNNFFTTEPLVGSAVRIRLADYYADIVCNSKCDPEIWHWVVQRDGSADILKWGQERDRGASELAAKTYLQSLVDAYKLRLIKRL